MPTDVRLEGASGEFLATQEAWAELLEVAVEHGWEPAHAITLYGADVGLVVGADDAAGLADALESGLDDGADPDDDEGGCLLGGPLDLNPEAVVELITFCRAGGFRVC